MVSQRLGKLGKVGTSKAVRKHAETHIFSKQEVQGDQVKRLKDRNGTEIRDRDSTLGKGSRVAPRCGSLMKMTNLSNTNLWHRSSTKGLYVTKGVTGS